MLRNIFLIVLLTVTRVRGLSSERLPTIRVCQNKDCRRRWKRSSSDGSSLVDCVKDIVYPHECLVISTSCLGQCDQGPNICIKDKILHECNDMIDLAARLELAMEQYSTSDTDPFIIEPKLVAASTVIEKAQNANINVKGNCFLDLNADNEGGSGSTTYFILTHSYVAVNSGQRERYLASVIQSLRNDPKLAQSTTLAHAHLLLAHHFYSNEALPEAIHHARQASTAPQYATKALRLSADSYLQLGDRQRAADALRDLARHDPSMKKKVEKEIHDIASEH